MNSSIHFIEEEAIEVEHLLAEPKRDHLSVDSVFCIGGMSSDSTTQGRDDDLRFEVFKEMVPEVDVVENFHETSGAYTACEDYLLDAECIEKVPGPDFTPCGLSSLENSSLESHSSEFGGTDYGDMGTSEMSTVSVPVDRSRNGTFDNVTVYQTQAKNRIKFHSSNSHDTKHHKENGIGNTRGVKGKLSAGIKGKAKKFFEASGDGNLDTQKRLRKPTKRFIEEVSERKSKKLKGKEKCSTSLKDKYVSEGRDKRRASTSESEDESYTDESDDDYGTTVRPGKGEDRRKNQRMWALSEVVKLVDGISHHGVGRWTEIKRLLFPTSDYRTPIDLRDKWRNLLRSSSSWLQSEGEDEQKQASRPLPRAVLHRISELASIYPYPKAGNSMQKRTIRVGKRGHRR